jgi:hypothetical protein
LVKIKRGAAGTRRVLLRGSQSANGRGLPAKEPAGWARCRRFDLDLQSIRAANTRVVSSTVGSGSPYTKRGMEWIVP